MTMNVRVTNASTTDMIEMTTTSSTSVTPSWALGPMQELREALHETFTVSAAGLFAFSGLRVTFALPVLAPLVAVIFHVP